MAEIGATRPAPRRLADWILGGITALVFVALYAPILLVFVLSFFRTRRGRVQWDTFSFEWYRRLFENEEIAAALMQTLLVGFTATLAAIVLATATALYAAAPQRSGRTRAVLEFLVFRRFFFPRSSPGCRC